MPQDGSGNYAYPLGTRGVPDETIESAAYNNFLDDLVGNDLNIPRPIHRGGTGATTADAALMNLGAEKAAQLVTNYDTHVWLPGSFRSAGSATAGPVDGHAFAGIVYINEPLASPPTNANVTVSARDMDDTVVPSRVYVREKKAGVWGAWTVIDATTLPFPPGGGFTATTILGAIQELDAEKVAKTGDTMTGDLTINKPYAAVILKTINATTEPQMQFMQGALQRWSMYASGGPDADLTVARYNDAGAYVDTPFTVDRIDGRVYLTQDPIGALGAATKQYVDNAIAAGIASFLPGSELRFNRASSQHMTRTFGTASSTSPWTMSMWVRRNTLGTHQALFGVEVSTNKFHVGFNSSNNIIWFTGTGGITEIGGPTGTWTTLGQWINIVWTCTTNAVGPSASGYQLGVNNGALVSGASVNPGLNTTVTHYIGQPAGYPDVFMKEVIFVDGSALPPSAFGVDVSGVWSPKIFGGPYGPNGFRLAFANQLSAANLGIDSSPNGNHWTAVNF
jgi:hypothetical protein